MQYGSSGTPGTVPSFSMDRKIIKARWVGSFDVHFLKDNHRICFFDKFMLDKNKNIHNNSNNFTVVSLVLIPIVYIL
jgi:phenylacetate-coenzyme A ligase PaaK-like adenylate-forming protein